MAYFILLGVLINMTVFCHCFVFSKGVDEDRFNQLKKDVEMLGLKLAFTDEMLASLEEETVPKLIHDAESKLTEDMYAKVEERLSESKITANNNSQSENLLNVEEIRRYLKFKEEAEKLMNTMKREINSINTKIKSNEEDILTCKQKSETLQSELQTDFKEMRLKQTKLEQGLNSVIEEAKLHAEFQRLSKDSESLKSYIDEMWTLLLIMILVVIILVILVAMVTWKQQNKAKYY